MENNNFKYHCEKCIFSTNYLSHWNEHLESKKHTGEKRKQRNDKILENKCKFCFFETKKVSNMKLHILNNHSNKDERRENFKFYCDKCDFGCFVKILFDRHLETLKHNN